MATSEFLGESEASRHIRAAALFLAKKNTTILLCGETGTGKEVLARYIHKCSDRASRQFEVVNCPAIPQTLAESILFGHEGGAFTDAKGPKKGIIETADRGTLFFDEVAELSLETQAKLLRFLGEEDATRREIRRVGHGQSTFVNVRVIAATNQNLESLIDKGAFRRDLYFRLNAFSLDIPPLRERAVDIRMLKKRFLPEGVILEESAFEKLARYRWPGNVRQLGNILEKSFFRAEMSGRTEIFAEDVVFEDSAKHELTDAGCTFEFLDLLRPDVPLPDRFDRADFLQAIDRFLVEKALTQCNGNKSQAAKLFGMTVTNFRGRCYAYGLAKPRNRSLALMAAKAAAR